MVAEKFLESEDIKSGARFLALFSVFFLASIVLVYFAPLEQVEGFVAEQALFVLEANSIRGILELSEPVLILLSTGHTISISFLCTGLLEIAVLASAILASYGISWSRRILGVLIAVFFAHLFNLARIVITVFAVLEQPPYVAELAHDFLFRLLLFAIVFLMYAVWFAIVTGKLQAYVPKGKGKELIVEKRK